MFQYSNARENQDLFLLCVLNGKRGGTYIEVGANQPIVDSNTYLLESKFDWSGISFEFSPRLVNDFNRIRKNVCIQADATSVDMTNIIRLSDFGPHFDYLQLDIDPPKNTLKALKNMDLNRFSFSVITFEHDLYAGGHEERLESRQIFESFGYTRVLSDVQHDEVAFEDWWIKEEHMESENWKHFVGSNLTMNTGGMSSATRELMESMLKHIKF